MSHHHFDEALPGPSKKRAHSDFIQTTDEPAKEAQNGEVAEQQDLAMRQGEKRAKRDQNPCWRCRILKKKCDGESPCKECDTYEGRLSPLGCQRDELADRLKDLIPVLPGFGQGDWLLPAINGINLKIHMEYEDPDVEIKDLDQYASESNIHTKPAIIAFIQQFHDLNNRWGNWYEPVTEGIINMCAAMQEDILRDHRSGREPLSEIDLILVSALRVFGLCHNIGDVQANLRPMSEEEFIEREEFVEPEDISLDKNPSIILHRHDPTFDKIAEMDGTLLQTLVHELVSKTQGLLLRGRPWDLPVLFCVLCLLQMIQGSITCDMPYIHMPSLYGSFGSVNRSLCLLYDAASKGHNPLVDVWDRDEYAALVGSHTLALEHFEVLNALWVNAGYQERGEYDVFFKRMERFVAGYESPDESEDDYDGDEDEDEDA